MDAIPSGVPSLAQTPVRCCECGIEVQVGKTSWQQTSVQWPPGGPGACPQLREPGTALADRVRTCPALQRSISKAVLAGTITIPE